MTAQPNPDSPSGVRHYTAVCLAAQLVLLLALMERGLGWYSLLPILVGSLSLLARWQAAPILLLICLGGLFYMLSLRSGGDMLLGQRSSVITDGLICLAALAYVAGNYRLQGLRHNILPADPRLPAALKARRRLQRASAGRSAKSVRMPSWDLPDPARLRRSPQLVSPGEIIGLLLSLPVWLTLAFLGWYWLASQVGELDFSDPVWRGMVFVWLLGTGLIIATGLLGYVSWSRWTRAEATMALQDVLWRETRREQGRLNRWLAWSRTRKKRLGE